MTDTQSHVDVERVGAEIAVLRLNRPDRLNALSFETVRQLHAAIAEIDADNTCRVVILTGSGRGFCSGLDLKDVHLGSVRAAGLEGGRAALRTQEDIAALMPELRRIQQPVIAAVNGPAFGGGFALALASDVRIAAPAATFCTQFIKLGLSGCDVGVSYMLPRLIGGGRAHELQITGRVVDAAEAERIGIVTEVVDADGLLDRAIEIAETICAYSPIGVVMTKEVMWANLDASGLDQAIALENRNQVLAGLSGGFAGLRREASTTEPGEDPK